MKIIKAHNLACPIDGERLESSENQLVCANGHAFDIARQGYVNLLPVQHKRSKQPGDSKEMVLARTQFLNLGVYEPVVNTLAEMILTQMTCIPGMDAKEICLLDAGCGEGYYLDAVFNILKYKANGVAADCAISFIGLDISKPAIAESAKRNKQISWLVGTNRQPPVSEASVDIILCVFGFQSYEGFSKILKPGGKIILVEPGEDHLKELREIIYTEVKKSEPADISYLEETGISLLDKAVLKFETGPIDNDQINNLLLMTPHFYRANKEGKEAAVNLKELNLSIDVIFSLFEKV